MSAARPREQHAFATSQVRYDPGHVRKGVVNTPMWGAQKTMSADDLIRILEDICREARSYGYDPGDPNSAPQIGKVYCEMWEKFKEFAREFPVMFRWTVHTQTVSVAAFRHYLIHHHLPYWKNRKEMLTAQAEYLVKKYQEANPRSASAKHSAEYRAGITKRLHAEDEQYVAATKEVQEIADAYDAAYTQRLRKALYDTVCGLAAADTSGLAAADTSGLAAADTSGIAAADTSGLTD